MSAPFHKLFPDLTKDTKSHIPHEGNINLGHY